MFGYSVKPFYIGLPQFQNLLIYSVVPNLFIYKLLL